MIFKIALKILQRNKQHTLRAIYGLSVSIAIIISLLAIFSGISIQISQIVDLSGNSTSITIQSSNGELIPSNILTNASMTNIKAITPIHEENAFIHLSQPILLKEVNVNISSYLQFHPDSYVQKGTFPVNQTEFMASTSLVSTLNLQLDNFYIINNTNMKLVGFIADNLELQNSLVFNDNPSTATFISVVLINPTIGTTTLTYLQSYLGSKYLVTFAKESSSYLTSIFSEILSKFSLILLIIIFISFIRIYFFVMWIIIHNINDFLILRILGYTKYQLISLVVFFALVIGNLGLFVGIILGICLPLILSNIIPIVTHLNYIPYIPDPSIVLVIIILINISIIIGSIRPSFELLRTNFNILTNG